MVGLVLALPPVWLTSSAEAVDGAAHPASTRSSIVDGVLAGVGFAVLALAGGSVALISVA